MNPLTSPTVQQPPQGFPGVWGGRGEGGSGEKGRGERWRRVGEGEGREEGER